MYNCSEYEYLLSLRSASFLWELGDRSGECASRAPSPLRALDPAPFAGYSTACALGSRSPHAPSAECASVAIGSLSGLVRLLRFGRALLLPYCLFLLIIWKYTLTFTLSIYSLLFSV